MSRKLFKLLMLISIQNKILNLNLHGTDIELMPNNTDTSKLTKILLVASIVAVMETLQTGD